MANRYARSLKLGALWEAEFACEWRSEPFVRRFAFPTAAVAAATLLQQRIARTKQLALVQPAPPPPPLPPPCPPAE